MRQPTKSVAETPTVTTLGRPGELQLTCSSLGASIVDLRVPVEAGFVNAVLGYPNAEDYLHDPYYMGAICGRYAGRIKQAEFPLNGVMHSITKDESARHALHGGVQGFNAREWTLNDSDSTDSLVYSLHSPDGDQGFPGSLDVAVTYTLRNNCQLVIGVEARSSRDTVVNLVSHPYFNLNLNNDPIDNHTVTVFARSITEQDNEGIPTGNVLGVVGTPFDLRPDVEVNGNFCPRRNQPLGSQAFDQNFVLDKQSDTAELAAVVSISESPVALAVYTTLPGLQLYTGDQLAGALAPRSGLCLEAQQLPDSPNQPSFPETVLKAGEWYRSRTIYAFAAPDDVRSGRDLYP